jgi:putative lipase involved disintegration of autophagic bodies
MIDFYQSVARSLGVTQDWRTANITTTGHSLGGGLAGLVAANDNAPCHAPSRAQSQSPERTAA